MWDWLLFQIGYWAGFLLTWAVILSPVALIAWLVWRRRARKTGAAGMILLALVVRPAPAQEVGALEGVTGVRVSVDLGRDVGTKLPKDSAPALDTADLRQATEDVLAMKGLLITRQSETVMAMGVVLYAAPTPSEPDRVSYTLQVMVRDRVSLVRNPRWTFPATTWHSQIFFGHARRRDLAVAVRRGFAPLVEEFTKAMQAANPTKTKTGADSGGGSSGQG